MYMYNIHVNATGQDLSVDFDTLPTQAREFIIAYGLRQKFNDCHVSAESKDEKAAMVDKTLAALESGEIRIGAARVADPVGAEIKLQSVALARQAAKKAGTKLTPEYVKSDAFHALVAKYAMNEKVIAYAKKAVEDRKALADF